MSRGLILVHTMFYTIAIGLVILGIAWWLLRHKSGPLLSSKSKVILISGCDSGFGLLSTQKFAELGCKVLAGCYSQNGIEILKELKNANIIPFQLDVTNQLLLQECPNGLWALINNAGIVAGITLELTSMQMFRKVMDTNLIGHVAMSQVCAPFLKTARGRIVNCGSMAGRCVNPMMNAYVTSKFAMRAFSDCLRQEMQLWDVTVVLIEPCFMNTPMVMKSSVANVDNVYNCTDIPQSIKDTYEKRFNFFVKMKESMSEIQQYITDDASVVVNAYVDASLSSNPRTHYKLGIGRTFFYIMSILPCWIQDFANRKHFTSTFGNG